MRFLSGLSFLLLSLCAFSPRDVEAAPDDPIVGVVLLGTCDSAWRTAHFEGLPSCDATAARLSAPVSIVSMHGLKMRATRRDENGYGAEIGRLRAGSTVKLWRLIRGSAYAAGAPDVYWGEIEAPRGRLLTACYQMGDDSSGGMCADGARAREIVAAVHAWTRPLGGTRGSDPGDEDTTARQSAVVISRSELPDPGLWSTPRV